MNKKKIITNQLEQIIFIARILSNMKVIVRRNKTLFFKEYLNEMKSKLKDIMNNLEKLIDGKFS